jgi:hypothetical protein
MTPIPTTLLQTRVFGLSLIGAPVLLLLSSLFHALDRDVWSGTIGFYAFLLYVPAGMALTTLLAERAPRWAVVARLFVTLGSLGGTAYSVVRAFIAAAEGKIDAAAIAELRTIEDMGLPFALNLPGIMFPLTMGAIGITLWRTGAVSAVHGIGIALAAIAFPLSRIPDVPTLYFISDTLFLVTLGAIGLRFFSIAGSPVRGPAATAAARA